VFLGGAKQDDPAALYGRIRRGIELGARGVVVGRNVWQSPDMDSSIAALRTALGRRAPSQVGGIGL
jgi:class I fructose-bisphosphate aldolase